MTGVLRACGLVVALALLAGCGKKSAPIAPGPANQIIYPHPYPNPARALD